MKIIATIGNESHSSSRGWANLSINGKKATWRDAVSKEWQTKYGDKHASWCECVFEVQPGDIITWEAGANSGSRGSDKRRQNLTFTADPNAEIIETESLGYPAIEARLEGRLVSQLDSDTASTVHEAMKADL